MSYFHLIPTVNLPNSMNKILLTVFLLGDNILIRAKKRI